MKIQVPKRIRTEDFATEDQAVASGIGSVINDFTDEVYRVLNKGVDFENLNRQVTQVVVTMDAAGLVVNAPQIKSTLLTKVRGINVINAVNINNTTIYPTTAPFVSFSTNSNLLTILNITGLQAGSQYQLTLELIG